MNFQTFYNELLPHLPAGLGYKTKLMSVHKAWSYHGLCEEFVFSFKQARRLGLDFISSVEHAYVEWDM